METHYVRIYKDSQLRYRIEFWKNENLIELRFTLKIDELAIFNWTHLKKLELET